MEELDASMRRMMEEDDPTSRHKRRQQDRKNYTDAPGSVGNSSVKKNSSRPTMEEMKKWTTEQHSQFMKKQLGGIL